MVYVCVHVLCSFWMISIPVTSVGKYLNYKYLKYYFKYL